MNMGGVEALVCAWIGLDLDTVGPDLIPGAVRRRLSALGRRDDDKFSYLRMIQESAEEFQSLIDEVVTTETWFFRDVEPFRLVAQQAARFSRSRPDDRPFRVLSAPCATGEEPYSLVMAFLDEGLQPWRFRVDAVDISRAALRVAQAGVYSANAFRNADDGFRARYFHKEDHGYQINPDVARQVHFHHANLLDPNLFSDRSAHDAVFCRNVLIYLDDPSRARLIANLDRWLSPDGRLYIGHADQLGLLDSHFRSLGLSGGFAYERRSASPARKALEPSRTPTPPSVSRKGSRSKPGNERAVDPVPALSPPSPPLPDREPSRLDQAAELANLGRYEEAAALCDREIQERGPSARSLFQLGIVRQAQGDPLAAEDALRKVIYLDGRHEEALLALSLLAQRRGDQALARRYRERAERSYREAGAP
ncbi:MAG: CheR family methyltransferase [Isosphaeraceae bacterium]